jgi:hypothetical protein
MTTLYRIHNGNVEPIATSPEGEARLALAPGGNIYAWLLPHRHGSSRIRLVRMNDGTIDLNPKDPRYGFSAFHMGFQGRMLVTASQLGDGEGIGGRFEYVFWNQQGSRLREVKVDHQQTCVLGGGGWTILFLGNKEAVAYSAWGQRLWGLNGKFRKAAVTREWGLALLNPSSRERINEVHIYEGRGDPRIVRIDTPVHDLILAPDGSSAVVVGDQGRYFLVNPSNGHIQQGPPLPFDRTFSITNLKFVDRNTLAMGVLHREGDPPKVTWPRGTILVMDLQGNVIFRENLSIQRASAGEPHIDVAFMRFIVGYTKEKTMLIKLRQ